MLPHCNASNKKSFTCLCANVGGFYKRRFDSKGSEMVTLLVNEEEHKISQFPFSLVENIYVMPFRRPFTCRSMTPRNIAIHKSLHEVFF